MPTLSLRKSRSDKGGATAISNQERLGQPPGIALRLHRADPGQCRLLPGLPGSDSGQYHCHRVALFDQHYRPHCRRDPAWRRAFSALPPRPDRRLRLRIYAQLDLERHILRQRLELAATWFRVLLPERVSCPADDSLQVWLVAWRFNYQRAPAVSQRSRHSSNRSASAERNRTAR